MDVLCLQPILKIRSQLILKPLKFLQNVEKDVTERDNVIVGNVMRQWDQDRTPHLLLFCCIIRHVSTQDRGDWCLL